MPEPKPWNEQCAAIADGMEAETATHEGRKAFYGIDGSKRAEGVIAQLEALKARFQKFVRA